MPKISRTTTTDAEGRFAFTDLPAGEYTLTATKPGYIDVVFGARRPGASSPGTPIRVEPGQRRDDIAVRMPRGGVITGSRLQPPRRAEGHLRRGVLKFAARTSEIVGSLTNPSGEPVTDYVLVLFPADRDQWVPQSRRIHIAQASSDGRFAIRGLPAGDYWLAPIAAVEPGQQFDSEFLTQALVGSVAVTLAEGERLSRDIRVK